MARIVVEARKTPEAGAFLDNMAATCRVAGHQVMRWRGPRSGRVPYGRWMWPCDLAILFNGTHDRYSQFHQQLDGWDARRIYVELGWYPQQGRFQVDPHGINAAASWATERLTCHCRTPLAVPAAGDLLVVLQHDHDTQITHMSPWFDSMYAFVKHLAEHSALRLRLRKHPRHDLDERLAELARRQGLVWDQSPSLTTAMETCRAVACINSSGAVEALANRLPVLCFGKAVYRHPEAVHCLTDDGRQLRAVTGQLAQGRCDLFVEAIDEIVRRIQVRQWTVTQIQERLPPLLDSLLAGCKPSSWWSRLTDVLPLRRAA
ncbi:MAG TPA: hypothetical protein VFB96_12435 [Pirellulaceae bacterium]|jgi:capsular polysaccharide biosynthesis protein|nr:hypothetical protein [Pirellulaceae bacterium]